MFHFFKLDEIHQSVAVSILVQLGIATWAATPRPVPRIPSGSCDVPLVVRTEGSSERTVLGEASCWSLLLSLDSCYFVVVSLDLAPAQTRAYQFRALRVSPAC